jgi:predicted nuclease of predicted toxin-antitoxin system
MTLLFDQNIALKSVADLDDVFPSAQHIGQLPEVNTDQEVLQHALDHKLVVVTTDQEFIDLALMLGIEPKILLIRGDRLTTNKVEWNLRVHEHAITQFATHPDAPKFLVINE